MQCFIQEVLWGTADYDAKVNEEIDEENPSSLIDELLDGIVHVAVAKYARNVSQKLTHMLSVSAPSHIQQKRYTQAVMNCSGPVEPAVSTVPRGWLNSGHAGIARRRMQPSAHLSDFSDDTLASLRQIGGGMVPGGFAALRSPPIPPPRQASLVQMPSAALRSALRSASKEDAWRQCQISTGPAVDALANFVGWGASNERMSRSRMAYQVNLTIF